MKQTTTAALFFIYCFAVNALILLFVAGCKKNSARSPMPPLKVNSGVFVGGIEKASNGVNVIKYWKAGVPVILGDSANTYAFCGGIVVTDSNVYVSGTEGNPGSPGTYVGKVWNNDVQVFAWPGYSAGNIAVSGTDIYVPGNSDNSTMSKYWKNGTSFNLPTDSSGDDVFASSVFVLGSDVYVSGTETFSDNSTAVKYWKNGIGTDLVTDENSSASGMFVSGSDIYLCGDDVDDASYWKNGIETKLTTNHYGGFALSMYISENNIYACGVDSNCAVYWKNGIETRLTNGINQDGFAYSIVVSGNDVYVAGNDGDTAKYWKNGVGVSLTNGVHRAKATAIFVK